MPLPPILSCISEWLISQHYRKHVVTLRLLHSILSYLPRGVLCRLPVSIFIVDMRQPDVRSITVRLHSILRICSAASTLELFALWFRQPLISDLHIAGHGWNHGIADRSFACWPKTTCLHCLDNVGHGSFHRGLVGAWKADKAAADR